MRYLIILFILIHSIFADEVNLLSNTKQEIIQLKQQKIKEKETSNKYDWLNDITIKGIIAKDNENIQSEDYSISLSQKIFNFGGINSQIDYAKELQKLETIDLQISTNEDLYTLFSLVLDIQLNEIALDQNQLNISNSIIDIKHKKSEYKAGELGITDLNEAMMTRNELQDNQKTLQLSKLLNMNELQQYTTKEYNLIQIPKLELMDKNTFLEHSNSIKYTKHTADVNNLLYKIEKSNYLPSLNLNSNYGYSKTDITTPDDYYSYGVSLSLPLSYTASSNIEQKKIDYLISKQELQKEISDTTLIYDKAILNISNYKERIQLATEDIILYEELILSNNEEYEAGYKTIDDVQTIQNSKRIRELDIKNYQLNIQKIILELYFKTI